jgi:hypothetical protein
VPDEIIRVHNQFYILAPSTRLHDRTRVLKDGDTFAIAGLLRASHGAS